ncbi:ApeI family dehydratase [Dyella koreensis]
MASAIATTLGAHPWVAHAAVGDAGVCLMLSAEGIAALRGQGRQACLGALRDHLAAHALGIPTHWRLCDQWNAVQSAAQIDALLAQPRAEHPLLLADHTQGHESALELLIPLDLRHFADHFPHLPVLPGVVQLAWALEFAAARLDTPKACRRMEMLKFQRLLRPGDRVQLRLRHDATAHRLHFAYQLGDIEASSGRFAWEAAHG